jgi:hypothetical protein
MDAETLAPVRNFPTESVCIPPRLLFVSFFPIFQAMHFFAFFSLFSGFIACC